MNRGRLMKVQSFATQHFDKSIVEIMELYADHKLKKYTFCPDCHGHGHYYGGDYGSKTYTCRTCKGEGILKKENPS